MAKEPKLLKELKGTSSIRYQQMRHGHILMPSVDKRELAGIPKWERIIGLSASDPDPFFCTNEPSPDGSEYFIIRPWSKPPGMSNRNVPKKVHRAQVQEGHKVRFHCDLHLFEPMEGYMDTRILIWENLDMWVYFPPNLSTGNPHTDAHIHGRNKKVREPSA